MTAKTYLFQPEKKILKQGFFMTDENDKVVYEAKMLKQPLIGPMIFEFVNHAANTKQEHKVGKTVTTEQSVLGGLLDELFTKSYFKFDGKKIWDYLHGEGIKINTGIQGKRLGMSYTVTQNGRELAAISTSTPKGKNIVVTSDSWLDVTAKEEDLDMAFLTAFAIARTDKTLYS